MKKTIIAMTLCISALAAAADPVLFEDYAVSDIESQIGAAIPTLEAQPYWGNSGLAQLAAETVADSYGMPNSYMNPNDEGLLFLYTCVPLPDTDTFQFKGWVYLDGSANTVTINGSYTADMAVLTDVPDATATLPLAALGAVTLVAFKATRKTVA